MMVSQAVSKVSFVLLVVFFLMCNVSSIYGQKRLLSKKVNIDLREVTIDSALNYVSYKTNVFFSFNSDIVDHRQRFTLKMMDSNVEQVLDQMLLGTGVEYIVINGQIILFKSASPSVTSQQFFEEINIRGNVRDSRNNEPIPGINVYVAGNLKGSSTDIYGNFELKGLTPGRYEIVFSHIVFELKTIPIIVEGDRQFIHMPVKLTPNVRQLKEVEVVANGEAQKQWRRGFRVFEQEFLGSTQNASKCKILNPEVLDISYDPKSGELSATAHSPLIIENEALGYRLNYVLELFERTNRVTRLLGISNFEELALNSKKEYRRVLRNREKSYRGSMIHFLRSLTDDRLKKEGFVTHEVDELPSMINESYFELPAKLHAEQDQFAFDNTLKFTKFLLVIYTHEYESAEYVLENLKRIDHDASLSSNMNLGAFRRQGQISFIKLNLPEVTVNARGFFNEPLAVTTYGYWSWERVAEYMPFDYIPR